MHDRLVRLRAAMAERGLSAILVSAPVNRRYLSGFTGSYGALLITPDAALILTDGRYRLQAALEAPAFALREVVNPGRPMPAVLAEATRELGLATLAFEAEHTSVAEHGRLSDALGGGVALLPADGLVEGLREQKDEAELVALQRAIAITDQALATVLPQLTPATTERQAAWLLEVAMREGGAEALSFPPIVASGPHAALPHWQPVDEPLGAGRPIVIDMGARFGGYHADLTRTVVLGEPDGRFEAIYGLVLAAQQRAIAGLRAGLRTDEADALARDHIAAAGHGEHFTHGLGHGVGLNIHEGPGLRRAAPGGQGTPLRAGMVTSVEPGVYIEGWGGVRIEDLVLITADGCEVLSRAPK
ncbi:MAG: aminopeptidase P family protein [Chloroflexi bacterium OHK40]